MRESKTLYFCRFSVHFFFRQVKHTVEIWKTTCINIQKDRMKLFHQAFGRRKKNSQTKSFQTIHFTSHTKAKVFTFPKYSSTYFAFLVSKKHFSFVYAASSSYYVADMMIASKKKSFALNFISFLYFNEVQRNRYAMLPMHYFTGS